VGTPPWDVLRHAKFQLLSTEATAQRVKAVAASIWEKVEQAAPEFFEGGVTVPIPSSRDLIHRCAALADGEGWPALSLDDRLVAEDRPRSSGLNAEQRREAAQGKYTFEGELDGAPVLLLDDVYTSGFTMHDAARAVRETCASSVVGVVYARRVFPDLMAVYRDIRDG
jgi:predicted amidophosphoribosyltransferase